jgi:site-specific recombinase
LFGKINLPQIESHSEKLAHQICNAIIVLCHRLTTMGIDPYLVSKMPEIDDSDSPFFELNHQVSVFVKKHQEDSSLSIDYSELNLVLHSINRCESLFKSLQFKKDEIGTSLHLTFLLKRAEQHISRVKLLLQLYLTKEYGDKTKVVSQLTIELVKAVHTKNRVKSFIKENTQLLANRIVSHTSEKGEHYIGFSKNENYKLFKSALGGGLVVVFLVYIKHWIHELHLSLFFEGFLFGLNYALGFVLMHLMHLTLATKQPAMTASYIAENIGNTNISNVKSWIVFKQILRSQFISLIGNLVVVLPLCFFISWLFMHYSGNSVFDHEESKAQMYSNHPFYSGSLIYACITGALLSLSGIIIGYFDNKVVYSEIPIRVIKHPKLAKYSLVKREQIAAFVERNLGAIVGNIFSGFCLGMAGNIGKFIGIPFDIRHITISAGNFGISLGGDGEFELGLVLIVFIGILLIGITNIASCFLISFVMACQSRGLSWKQSLKVLLGIV